MLADRLPGHVEPRAELAQGLAVAGVEAVEQQAAVRVGERPEHLVHLIEAVRSGDDEDRARAGDREPRAALSGDDDLNPVGARLKGS